MQTTFSIFFIVFVKKKSPVKLNSDFHFGFRLPKPSGLKNILQVIKKAGGKVKETGEFVPGEPYVFFYDPDGYEVEIWFEKIPPSLKSFN